MSFMSLPRNGSYEWNGINLDEPEEFTNLMISLCHKQGFLMDRFLQGVQNKFVEEGDFRENLFKKRTAYKKGAQGSSAIIILVVATFVLLAVGVVFTGRDGSLSVPPRKEKSNLPLATPSAQPTTKTSPLPEKGTKPFVPPVLSQTGTFPTGSELVYIASGDLYLLTSEGSKSLTHSGKVASFKLSGNKKYLTWISAKTLRYVADEWEGATYSEQHKVQRQKEFNLPNAVFLLDLKSGESTLLVQAALPSDAILIKDLESTDSGKIWRLGINDADVSFDGTKVIFTGNEGLWLKDLTTEKEQQLAKNVDFQQSKNGVADVKHYNGVYWQPDGTKVLLLLSGWEVVFHELYDSATGILQPFPIAVDAYDVRWSSDGRGVYAWGNSRMGSPGVWQKELGHTNVTQLPHITGEYDISGFSWSARGKMAAIFSPFGASQDYPNKTDLPSDKQAIYLVDSLGMPQMLAEISASYKERSAGYLQWSPNEQFLSFIKTPYEKGNYYDLDVFDLSGKEVFSLHGINAYSSLESRNFDHYYLWIH